MKWIYLIAITVGITAIGCKKTNNCAPVSPASEETALQGFASNNSISATKHSSGMFYQITNPGSGVSPNLNSTIIVTYAGSFLNGTVFEQTTNPVNIGQLGGLIEGWKVGLPLIQKGGRIKLIIPSSMAYGCTGVPGISANTPLFFDITLVDVQ